MEMVYTWLVLVSFAGGFLQAAIGFGYATIVMVFFPAFLPSMPVASTVCAVLSLLASAVMLFRHRKAARPKHVLWPILIYFVVMPFAVAWSAGAPKLILSVIFGLFLVLLGLYYLFRADKIRIPATPAAGMAAGLLSGVFGGLFAVSAPPAALYCLSTLDTKEEYIGTLQFFFFVTNTYAVGVRTFNGLVTSQVLLWSLAASGGLLLGLWLGQAVLYKHANLSRVKTWVFVFIACMGVWTVVSNFI
ncbi:MAG: sulfite exporter TauE/SafE family protein [Clostridiaceae bacterium]|nr:sulfite exporter TauE/SafE family protein [Eubacteriales bacterium]